MNDISTLGFPEAARRIGVPLRMLRHAIRAGRIPAPTHHAATATLSAEWLASAQAAIEAFPSALRTQPSQKVAAFARYKGTSAWRKYTYKVRAHARFHRSENSTRPG